MIFLRHGWCEELIISTNSSSTTVGMRQDCRVPDQWSPSSSISKLVTVYQRKSLLQFIVLPSHFAHPQVSRLKSPTTEYTQTIHLHHSILSYTQKVWDIPFHPPRQRLAYISLGHFLLIVMGFAFGILNTPLSGSTWSSVALLKYPIWCWLPPMRPNLASSVPWSNGQFVRFIIWHTRQCRQIESAFAGTSFWLRTKMIDKSLQLFKHFPLCALFTPCTFGNRHTKLFIFCLQLKKFMERFVMLTKSFLLDAVSECVPFIKPVIKTKTEKLKETNWI